MECEQVREALSARIDGEATGVAAARLDSHLVGCPACAAWLAQAEQLTRAVRLQPVRVPDLTTDVLAAVSADPRASGAAAAAPHRHRTVLRVALALAAAVQIALALPALAGADLHLSREVASFEVAVAVGFAVAAWRPERARGLVPVAAVLAVALAVTSAVDMVSAQTVPGYEVGHLAAMVQAGLLWTLARQESGRRGTSGPAVAAA